MLYSVLFVSCPCILIPRHNISIDYKLFRPFFCVIHASALIGLLFVPLSPGLAIIRHFFFLIKFLTPFFFFAFPFTFRLFIFVRSFGHFFFSFFTAGSIAPFLSQWTPPTASLRNFILGWGCCSCDFLYEGAQK